MDNPIGNNIKSPLAFNRCARGGFHTSPGRLAVAGDGVSILIRSAAQFGGHSTVHLRSDMILRFSWTRRHGVLNGLLGVGSAGFL